MAQIVVATIIVWPVLTVAKALFGQPFALGMAFGGLLTTAVIVFAQPAPTPGGPDV